MHEDVKKLYAINMISVSKHFPHFSTKTILITFLLVSFLIVIYSIFFNHKIPCSGVYSRIWEVLSDLSLAYISSYIFYYIVVELKEKRDKKNVYISVYYLTSLLIQRAYSVYHIIIEGASVDIEKYNKRTITRQEYRELCNKVNPNATNPSRGFGPVNNLRHGTYGEFIHSGAVEFVLYYSERIFVYMPFLDSEHIKLINKLKDSKFYLMSNTLTFRTNNSDFSVYADNMYDFLEDVRALDDYNEKTNKKLAGLN